LRVIKAGSILSSPAEKKLKVRHRPGLSASLIN